MEEFENLCVNDMTLHLAMIRLTIIKNKGIKRLWGFQKKIKKKQEDGLKKI